MIKSFKSRKKNEMVALPLSCCMAKPSNSFFGDFELSLVFRLSGPGKLKKTVTFNQNPFFKGREWQNLVTSCFDCSYFTGKT